MFTCTCCQEFDEKYDGWAVVYHGTAVENAHLIIQTGVVVSCKCSNLDHALVNFSALRESSVQWNFVKKHKKEIGIEHLLYFTPSIEYAALYSPPFKEGRNWCQVVFQCRVNLKQIIAKKPATGVKMKFKDPHFKTSQLEWFVFSSLYICL